MKPASIILAVLFIGSNALAAGDSARHTLFTAVLTSHVRNGRVDYAAIKRDRRFTSYFASLSVARPDTMSVAEQTAFWINAYNACVIRLVCDNIPLASIRDLDNGQIDDRPMFTVASSEYSLRSIIVDHLLPLRDRRIYTVLCMAARSSPPLHTQAYEASTLETQLAERSAAFLRDTTLNTIDTATKRLNLSRVFEWNLPAFGTNYRQLTAIILPWYHPSLSSVSQPPDWQITFREFDWTLNVR